MNAVLKKTEKPPMAKKREGKTCHGGGLKYQRKRAKYGPKYLNRYFIGLISYGFGCFVSKRTAVKAFKDL